MPSAHHPLMLLTCSITLQLVPAAVGGRYCRTQQKVQDKFSKYLKICYYFERGNTSLTHKNEKVISKIVPIKDSIVGCDESVFYQRSKSRSTCACLPVRQSQILSSGTKLYSPNLCLGKSIVFHIVFLFVCQFFMSWSGIPHSFQKIQLQ